MSGTPFFVRGLQPGNVIHVRQFDDPNPLAITVTSGSVAGSGVVYILKGAMQRRDPRGDPPPPVAIKVIVKFIPENMSPEDRAEKERIEDERVQREIAVVHRVRHQYILPFVGAVYTARYTVIISHFMENGDMLQYIKANPAARPTLILQVAIAVDYLHSQEGIVHGDLKCENVLVSPTGQAQLTDFGFSTPVEKPSNEDTTAAAIRASTTLRFAAPELLLDAAKAPNGRTKSKTSKSDVYAFGMLILQAFSGARPWPDLNDQAVLQGVPQGMIHPRLAKATAAGLNDRWWQLCRVCWKFTPEERPSMPEAATCIRSIMRIPEPASKTEQTHTGGSRFKWPWS